MRRLHSVALCCIMACSVFMLSTPLRGAQSFMHWWPWIYRYTNVAKTNAVSLNSSIVITNSQHQIFIEFDTNLTYAATNAWNWVLDNSNNMVSATNYIATNAAALTNRFNLFLESNRLDNATLIGNAQEIRFLDGNGNVAGYIHADDDWMIGIVDANDNEGIRIGYNVDTSTGYRDLVDEADNTVASWTNNIFRIMPSANLQMGNNELRFEDSSGNDAGHFLADNNDELNWFDANGNAGLSVGITIREANDESGQEIFAWTNGAIRLIPSMHIDIPDQSFFRAYDSLGVLVGYITSDNNGTWNVMDGNGVTAVDIGINYRILRTGGSLEVLDFHNLSLTNGDWRVENVCDADWEIANYQFVTNQIWLGTNGLGNAFTNQYNIFLESNLMADVWYVIQEKSGFTNRLWINDHDGQSGEETPMMFHLEKPGYVGYMAMNYSGTEMLKASLDTDSDRQTVRLAGTNSGAGYDFAIHVVGLFAMEGAIDGMSSSTITNFDEIGAESLYIGEALQKWEFYISGDNLHLTHNTIVPAAGDVMVWNPTTSEIDIFFDADEDNEVVAHQVLTNVTALATTAVWNATLIVSNTLWADVLAQNYVDKTITNASWAATLVLSNTLWSATLTATNTLWAAALAEFSGGGSASFTNAPEVISVWIVDTNWIFLVDPTGTYTNLISKTYDNFDAELAEAGL